MDARQGTQRDQSGGGGTADGQADGFDQSHREGDPIGAVRRDAGRRAELGAV